MTIFKIIVFAILLAPLVSATPAHAQRKGIKKFLFRNVIEGKPMPIRRLGIDKEIQTEDDLKADGFAIYREGNGGVEQFRHLACDLGVTEMFVLSGNGHLEEKWSEELRTTKPCLGADGKPDPTKKNAGIKVVFGKTEADMTKTKEPLAPWFMDKFDRWAQEAKAAGKKIAFRCECGCHRTGRLAAYAEMTLFGKTADEAYERHRDAFDGDNAGVKGKFFARKYMKRSIKNQVQALGDYLAYKKALEALKSEDSLTLAASLPKPCKVRSKYCVDIKATVRPEVVAPAAIAPAPVPMPLAKSEESALDQADASCLNTGTITPEPDPEDVWNRLGWGKDKSCVDPSYDDL